MVPLKPAGDNHSLHVPASGGGQEPSGPLNVWIHQRSLCLCAHTAFSSRACAFTRCFYIRTARQSCLMRMSADYHILAYLHLQKLYLHGRARSQILPHIFGRFYLFMFRERGREGEREGEKHPCVVASCAPPTGNLACNPGMCPDWELNRRPFGLQVGARPTEPHQPGPPMYFLKGHKSLNRSCTRQKQQL